MAKAVQKFYALKGRESDHIFLSWAECQDYRKEHHSGVFRVFNSIQDARAYLTAATEPAPDDVFVRSLVDNGLTSYADSLHGIAVSGVFVSGKNGSISLRFSSNTGEHKIKNPPAVELAAIISLADAAGIRVAFAVDYVLSLLQTDPVPAAPSGVAVVYSDGSYNPVTKEWGYGTVFFEQGNESAVEEYFCKGKKYAQHRQIAGELAGAVRGIQEAISRGYKKVELHYDYTGVCEWAQGHWQTNTDMSAAYQRLMRELMRSIQIEFVKVKAHTGDTYNERADALAKKAAGI